MERLDVKFEHCFGISKFEQTFDFSNNNCVLIYAPNGMMKSSFANTFECIAKEDKKDVPCDRIYPTRKTVCVVMADGTAINAQSIFVANAESEININQRITTFLASKELKAQYDSIYQELQEAKSEFLPRLKDVSKSTDCEYEIISTFGTSDKDTLLSCLASIKKNIVKECKFYDFRYNDVFDKKGNVKKFVDKNKELIQQYFTDYHDLLAQSEFFKSNERGVSFGTYQANSLAESVADESFFAAKHKITLNSGKEITSATMLHEIINTEIQKVVKDDKLKTVFDKIDKAIGNNTELRAFKAVLEKDNTIIPLLMDYDGFKKVVWYGFLSKIEEDVNNLILKYNSKIDVLNELLRKAREESSTWETIIDIYNKRFCVPFIVEIENKEDVILKQETANIAFKYKDINGELVAQSKDNLLQVMSRGERRAFYILQILFEIEARKQVTTDSLLILDDIADSFDYKNKYAIIEYLADLHVNSKFKIILLTHNFDFYRTVDSRLNLGRSVYMAFHDTTGGIKLHRGEYRRDVFSHLSKCKKDPKVFISLIPFVRNIIEYSKGAVSEEYIRLTNCLHIKNSSTTITADDICNIYKSNIYHCQDLIIEYGNKKIIDLIIETADTISQENPLLNEILLENKLVLSIAIRLRTEKAILAQFGDDINTADIKSDQTRVLIDKYKDRYPSNIENISIFDRVNLMTPENIHVNAFMYEPLIDMSVMHLTQLYNDIKTIE